MDDFEKEYFEKLSSLVVNFQHKRRDIAASRIRMFAAALARQLIDQKQNFSLLVAAGNSGLFMVKIAAIVYETLSVKMPPILLIPIVRQSTDNNSFDNSILLSQVRQNLIQFSSLEKMLFIDDEIMRAITAKTALELILKSRPDIKHIDATIIAENHFFEWHYDFPQVSARFFAYSRT